ncbi:MAG: hypothetical protein OJF49_000910 [Ktedonobacterales bacterium]|jgi:formylglycine-generating enzyme required for sulfatase activity/tetratricopeptide (TPR) repeat protein|nr:MAG: hypothetical protein OJF49_000910 [Ktedonobacterales bacterium]
MSASSATQTPRIFVSHSRKDDTFTLTFADDLRNTGAYVWVDMHDIREGDFLKRINEGLAKCDWLVLVETPHSLASDAVAMEVNAAQNRVLYGQMRGVIRLVAAARDPRTVQPLWATLQYYDATTDYPAAFAALLAAIRAGDADYARHATATNATGGYAHSPASTLASAPIPAAALPASLAQLPQRIADAYNANDWHAVADRSDLLLAEAPKSATLDLYRMRGRAFLELSRPSDACQALEAALKLDPLDLPTMRALARIYAQLKRYADAAPLLKKADALADDATRLDILREYVPILQAQNDWNEVLSRTAEALFLRRDDPAWLAVRLDALTHLGRDADALAIARQLAARSDATAADHLTLARAARTANDLSEATRAVHSATKLAPNDPALALERSATLVALATQLEQQIQRQQWPDALATLDAELSLAPDDRDRQLARADLLRRAGRQDEAVTAARALASRAPTPPAPAQDLALARLCATLSLPAEAWACLQRGGFLSSTAAKSNPEALSLARELVALPDATTAEHLILARLTAASGDLAGAWNLVQAAARTTPPDSSLVAQVRAELFPPPTVAPRLAQLGYTGHNVAGAQFLIAPLCQVPAGPFRMGSDPRQDTQAQASEQPQHDVTLPAYWIARYPITVAEYACFVRSGHAAPNDWTTQQGKLDHPVVYVSWHDAVAYAAWLAKLTGQPWRLPTEAEWEKAARWDPQRRASRLYPWGDTFDQSRANTRESGKNGTTPVGSYPNGASPCGAQDLAGNVWEWNSSLYKPYPYSSTDGRENLDNSTENRVLRVGSWGSSPSSRARPTRSSDLYIGFRLALLAAAGS